MKNSIKIQPGTLHGGEEIQPGTLHGGEEIQPGTLHGGEEIQPGTLHGGEEIQPGTLHGGEEIQPGTLHGGEERIQAGTLRASSFTPATYRTKDGRAYYRFSFVDIGGKFEIDILEQPPYGHRDDSSAATHRLPSSRSGEKICISAGFEPNTLEKAKRISVEWAELTNTYIKTGKNIDAQVIEIVRKNEMKSRNENSNNSHKSNNTTRNTEVKKSFLQKLFEELDNLMN